MRTETGDLVLVIARRILDEHESGRSVDPMRLEWARWTVSHNRAPEPDVHAHREIDE